MLKCDCHAVARLHMHLAHAALIEQMHSSQYSQCIHVCVFSQKHTCFQYRLSDGKSFISCKTIAGEKSQDDTAMKAAPAELCRRVLTS